MQENSTLSLHSHSQILDSGEWRLKFIENTNGVEWRIGTPTSTHPQQSVSVSGDFFVIRNTAVTYELCSMSVNQEHFLTSINFTINLKKIQNRPILSKVSI